MMEAARHLAPALVVGVGVFALSGLLWNLAIGLRERFRRRR